MADNPSKVGGGDLRRINIRDAYEVRFWSEKFGVSEEVLKEAVKHVGTGAKEVEQALVK